VPKVMRRISKKRVDGGVLEDWVAEGGSGVTAPKQDLRYIRFKKGRVVCELLTTVRFV